MIGIESDWTDLNSLSGDVFLLKLASNVSFDESSLSDSTISDQDDFELSNNILSLHFEFQLLYFVGMIIPIYKK